MNNKQHGGESEFPKNESSVIVVIVVREKKAKKAKKVRKLKSGLEQISSCSAVSICGERGKKGDASRHSCVFFCYVETRVSKQVTGTA